jgi:hypothetical protein
MRNRVGRRGWLATLLLCAAAACHRPPPGPPFEWAPPASQHRGRVYIYRSDKLRSLSVVEVSIDDRVVGTFRDAEYETLEMAPGLHRLRAGLRGFGYFNLGWNDSTFQVERGGVVYIQLEIRIDTSQQPALGTPRELEIGGRPTATASENIFIIKRPAAKAADELKSTRRRP